MSVIVSLELYGGRVKYSKYMIYALLILSTCSLLQCKDEQKEKVKAGVDKAKEKVANVKQGVSKLKEHARELPDKLIRDRQAKQLLSLNDEEFEQLTEDHLHEMQRYDDALARLLADVSAQGELFPNGDKSKDFKALKPGQRKAIREYYATFLDYMRALDGVKQSWQSFGKINPLTHKERHSRAFLLSYTAWLIQYRYGLMFIDAIIPNMPFETFLDEASLEFGIPEKSFAQMKLQIVQVKSVTRFLGSHQYFKTQQAALDGAQCDESPRCKWAREKIAAYHDFAKGQLKERAAIQFSYNAYDIVRDMAFETWFPLQSGVAEWMGDTKVKRLHNHLITDEQIVEMRAKMKPGDIVVARKNWYLSNIGLPGFWPHAELYLGAPGQLDLYFADADLEKSIPQLKNKTLSDYLSATYPEAWAAYVARPDHHGEQHEVIESMSEGVVFSSLERAAGADYVGVLRARRGKVEQAQAIIKSFKYWGRPYDFNFDFLTDSSIVCTELVYKAWEKSKTHDGLDIPLVEIMGRKTLPANEYVRYFAMELEKPEKDRQLDFVYFLDGKERIKGAVVSSPEEFAVSCTRPKWDVVQE